MEKPFIRRDIIDALIRTVYAVSNGAQRVVLDGVIDELYTSPLKLARAIDVLIDHNRALREGHFPPQPFEIWTEVSRHIKKGNRDNIFENLP